jgi:hypothetical protein
LRFWNASRRSTTRLSFDVTHTYTSAAGIKIPLVISFGRKEIQTTGYADCGAEACIFTNEIGQLLGGDIEAGEPKWFGSASGGTLDGSVAKIHWPHKILSQFPIHSHYRMW